MNSFAGGFSFFVKQFTDGLSIYAGIDNIENLIQKNVTPPAKAGIRTSKNGYEIRFLLLNELKYAFIPYNKIKSIRYIGAGIAHTDTGETVTQAVVGGLLFGPIGAAIAGGASAAANKNARLCIAFDMGTEQVVFGVLPVWKKQFENFLKKTAPDGVVNLSIEDLAV